MIVYRVHVVETEGVVFVETKTEAIRVAKGFRVSGLKTYVEALEVGTGKTELVLALNSATMHPDHWPGEPVG